MQKIDQARNIEVDKEMTLPEKSNNVIEMDGENIRCTRICTLIIDY